MKVAAYFFDNYTNESIWIAGILWPVYFLPFYLFYNKGTDKINRNFILPGIAALMMASFTALIFADSLIQYLVFMTGLGILVFGSMAMSNPDKKSALDMTIGIATTILSGLILYLMRFYVYKRKTIPNTKGDTGTLLTTGALIWITIMVVMYGYIFYYMLK